MNISNYKAKQILLEILIERGVLSGLVRDLKVGPSYDNVVNSIVSGTLKFACTVMLETTEQHSIMIWAYDDWGRCHKFFSRVGFHPFHSLNNDLRRYLKMHAHEEINFDPSTNELLCGWLLHQLFDRL